MSVCVDDRATGPVKSSVEQRNEDVHQEAIIAEMARLGEHLKRKDVLECFSDEVLRVLISNQAESPSASTMFARLQASVDARTQLQELERGMDKEHFVELVTGGYAMFSGVDKLTGFPILWVRSGPLNSNCWRYVHDSPRAKAFIRAYIYFHEVSFTQCARPGASSVCGMAAVYTDLSESRMLDFNLRVYNQTLRLMRDVFVLKGRRFVIGGAHGFFSVVLDVVCKVLPQVNTGTMQLIKMDEVEELVENVDVIPEFWFGDGQGRPYLSKDRRNVWCYERCLSDDDKITQKDLFNPGPWPYEEVDYDALKLDNSNQSRPDTLDTIEEDGEEDEW